MTPQQTFETALRHHQAGRLAQAEGIYRQILVGQPDHADALHFMGLLAHQTGRNDAALDLIGRAIALRPNSAEAHYHLGNALMGQGRLEDAAGAYRRAIALRPNFPEACANLGIARADGNRLDDAVAAFRQAIALRPNFLEALGNLGNALAVQGRFDDAIAAFRQVIALRPDLPEGYSSLGIALKEKNQLSEAIAACRQAIALRPTYAEAYVNLGNILMAMGQLSDAIAAYRQAASLRPDLPEAHSSLGNALWAGGQFEAAILACRRAIDLRPTYADAHLNLGNALKDTGHLDEAVAAYRQASVLKPGAADAFMNLGNVLKDKGELDEAIAAYRQAVALKPNHADAHGSLICTMHYNPAYNAQAIADEYRLWNRRHAEPLQNHIRPHANDRNPERRLRIGYVSPDFKEHPVGRFLLPLLAHHDRQGFEVFAYVQLPVPDSLTQRLRGNVDRWRSIVGLSHDQAAELIRQDQIDVLIDLTMHTANNRLLVFARKPAPVQVTWLAYCSSSGLKTIDYRLSDPYLDPVGMDESIYSERTIRLPETYWCYQPHIATPDVGPLPALEQGVITFGCLNNFCKVSEPTLAAWITLIRAIPGSRLLLHAHEGSHRQKVFDRLKSEGVDPQRLRFVGKVPTPEYFGLYQTIDIALDTFPYAGGTTTCDALWMGVPVVSLAGATAVGRAGLSILSNIGLPELVARNPHEYVRIAANLAGDMSRLKELRLTLRQRMQASPLMDAPKFARNIEAAYRRMWRTWCDTD